MMASRWKPPQHSHGLIIESFNHGQISARVPADANLLRPAPSLWFSSGMPLRPTGFIEPCLPTVSRTVPTGDEWAYEIKHDGFRFISLRAGRRVRAFTRGGHDWSGRLPAVTEAMRAVPARSVTLDGEVVIRAPDGRSDSTACARCWRDGAPDAFLYAFDVLELDGRDMRSEPWARRRDVLVQLLADAEPGIRLCEHIEDTDGAVVFRAVCNMGLEGNRRQAARQPLPLGPLARLDQDSRTMAHPAIAAPAMMDRR